MIKRLLPALIWCAAGVLLCIYFVGFGQGMRLMDGGQIFLVYGGLLLGVGGLMAHTILWRKDNLSRINFGYKIAVEIIVILLVLTSFLEDFFSLSLNAAAL